MPCLVLTFNFRFNTFNSSQSKFLVRQAKSGESNWLRSQPDKVSRPSEPIWNIAAPPRNQAANRENKHQPIVSEEAGLLDSLLSSSPGGKCGERKKMEYPVRCPSGPCDDSMVYDGFGFVPVFQFVGLLVNPLPGVGLKHWGIWWMEESEKGSFISWWQWFYYLVY